MRMERVLVRAPESDWEEDEDAARLLAATNGLSSAAGASSLNVFKSMGNGWRGRRCDVDVEGS